jgi:hypothetical protein
MFSWQLPLSLVMVLAMAQHGLLVAVVESFTQPAFHPQRAATTAAGDPQSRLFLEKETLKFEANFTLQSDQLGSNKKDELRAWVQSKTCRNHFLSAGGTTPISEVPLTPELEQLWTEACAGHYGADSRPEKNDVVIVSETVIQFPGLKMENSVYSGVKLLEQGDYPAYRSILIAEKQRVFGAAPIVWIFNQLTGNSAKKDDAFTRPMGMAKSNISILQEENSHYIKFDCNIQVAVKFPKVLVKIMPTSKEKMEEQGNAAVKKAVEKDVKKCVESASAAFLSWQMSETKANASG